MFIRKKLDDMITRTSVYMGLTLLMGFYGSSAFAQKSVVAHPPKVTRTPKRTNRNFKPGSTLTHQSRCKMLNGKNFPFPCEFSFDKLEVYAKDGSLIGEMTRTKPNLTSPLQKCKQGSALGASHLYSKSIFYALECACIFSGQWLSTYLL